jgi:hypothetical protein
MMAKNVGRTIAAAGGPLDHLNRRVRRVLAALLAR